MSEDRDQELKLSQPDDGGETKSEEKWEDPVLPPDDFSDASNQEEDTGDDVQQASESKKGKAGLLAFALIGLVGIGGAGFAYMHFGRSDQQLVAAPAPPAVLDVGGQQQTTTAAATATSANEPQQQPSLGVPGQASGPDPSVGQIAAQPGLPSVQPVSQLPTVTAPQMPDQQVSNIPSAQVPTVNSPTVALDGVPKLPEVTATTQQDSQIALPSTGHPQDSSQIQHTGMEVSATQSVPSGAVQNGSLPVEQAVPAVAQTPSQAVEAVLPVPQTGTAEPEVPARNDLEATKAPGLPLQNAQDSEKRAHGVQLGDTKLHPATRDLPEVKSAIPSVTDSAALAGADAESRQVQAKSSAKHSKPSAKGTQSKKASQAAQSGKKTLSAEHAKAGNKTSGNDTKKMVYSLRSAMPDEAWVSVVGSDDIQHVKTGDSLPGIGRIQSIQLQGGDWVVKGARASIR